MKRSVWPSLAWVAFTVTLMLTLYGGYRATENNRLAVEKRFETTVNQIDWHLRQRVLAYEQVLRGGVALFMASDDVNRDEWKRYVDNLYLSASYPGIQGVGFARKALPDERAALTKSMRDDGLHDFHIHPEGDRDVYYPIVYIEPLDWRNQRALGYDMYAEETRRAAMTRARDEGVTALSGKVELVQEVDKGKQAGFLLYLPLYQRGTTLDTPEQRRKAFRGFVYSPFRMGDFMEGSFSGLYHWIPDDELIELEIFDGDSSDESALMWASEKFHEATGGLVRDKTFSLYGHEWTVRVVARPAYFERYGARGGIGVYVGGALVALLLFVAAIRADRRRERESSEERFRSLVTTIPGAVYACQNEPKWNFDFVSPHIFDVTGYAPELFLPPKRSIRMEELIVPEDREMVYEKVRQGVANVAPYFIEYRIKNARGKERWIAERGRGVFDSSGTLDHLTGVLVDITDQKQAEVDLTAAKEAAEEATKVKDQFVNLVAHDLRSPFAAIVGAMRVIREEGDACMKPETLSMVDSVIQSGDRMTHMIEELLDISRLQTGKITPRPRFIDAHQITAAAIAGVSLQAATKGISLENNVPIGMRIYADPELLHEVLQNLLSNGVKFLSAGQRVIVSADPTRAAGLSVEDNGPGIDATIREDLFRHEVKTSTKGSAGEIGTGLGLPYAHDLMKAMKGDLDVESSPAIGARFRLALPALRPMVLVVDDEKGARLLMIAQLKELDVDTVEASGGGEALTIMKEERIDCVVTDLNMPDIDGLELLQAIKKQKGDGPPVMVVTADHAMETRVKIIRAGADDFLTKPVDKNDLIPRLRRFLS